MCYSSSVLRSRRNCQLKRHWLSCARTKENNNNSLVVIMHGKENILHRTSIACIDPGEEPRNSQIASYLDCLYRSIYLMRSCVPTLLLVGAVIEILDLAVVRKERKVVSYLHCNTTRSVYLLRRCAVVVVRGLRLNQPAPAVRLPQRPELSLNERPQADL